MSHSEVTEEERVWTRTLKRQKLAAGWLAAENKYNAPSTSEWIGARNATKVADATLAELSSKPRATGRRIRHLLSRPPFTFELLTLPTVTQPPVSQSPIPTAWNDATALVIGALSVASRGTPRGAGATKSSPSKNACHKACSAWPHGERLHGDR